MQPLIAELLLWDNCNNNCTFCHLKCKKSYNGFLNNEEKVNALQDAYAYVTGPDLPEGSDLLLCGGELFDTPLTPSQEEAFDKLANEIFNRMSSGKLHDLFLNTNLIYDMNIYLLKFLSIASNYNCIPKIHFTTSYDLVGRYKCQADKIRVKDNIWELKKLYPNLTVIANMILTKPVCQMFVNEMIDYLSLQQELNATLSLIPYIILNDSLAPTKELLFETLDTIERQVPGFVKTLAEKFANEPERLLLKFYKGELHNQTSSMAPCGHSRNFAMYSNDGTCFVCDILKHAEELSK